MVNAFLKPAPQSNTIENTESFVRGLVNGEGARGSGGFSLVCGRIGAPLAVVSNRMTVEGEVKWISDGGRGGETVGLSNAAFGDRSWPKVVDGERRMIEAIRQFVESEAEVDEIVQSLMELLSVDTLPRREENEDQVSYIRQLKKSIFVPKFGSNADLKADTIATAESDAKILAIKATSGAYGTQKQTVIIVNQEGVASFVERTLYDEQGRDMSSDLKSVRKFQFKIDFASNSTA